MRDGTTIHGTFRFDTLPPALEGRKPLAGGEGAQHREPPVWRITPDAISGGVLEGREKGPPAPGPRRDWRRVPRFSRPSRAQRVWTRCWLGMGPGVPARQASLHPRLPSVALPGRTVFITLRVMRPPPNILSAPTRSCLRQQVVPEGPSVFHSEGLRVQGVTASRRQPGARMASLLGGCKGRTGPYKRGSARGATVAWPSPHALGKSGELKTRAPSAGLRCGRSGRRRVGAPLDIPAYFPSSKSMPNSAERSVPSSSLAWLNPAAEDSRAVLSRSA